MRGIGEREVATGGGWRRVDRVVESEACGLSGDEDP
jgi:hypothetical protein